MFGEIRHVFVSLRTTKSYFSTIKRQETLKLVLFYFGYCNVSCNIRLDEGISEYLDLFTDHRV